jgi:hypothetical protein
MAPSSWILTSVNGIGGQLGSSGPPGRSCGSVLEGCGATPPVAIGKDPVPFKAAGYQFVAQNLHGMELTEQVGPRSISPRSGRALRIV